jgi:hypothetical protein
MKLALLVEVEHPELDRAQLVGALGPALRRAGTVLSSDAAAGTPQVVGSVELVVADQKMVTVRFHLMVTPSEQAEDIRNPPDAGPESTDRGRQPGGSA